MLNEYIISKIIEREEEKKQNQIDFDIVFVEEYVQPQAVATTVTKTNNQNFNDLFTVDHNIL